MAHGKLRYIKPGGHWTGENLAKALSYGGNYKKTDDNLWVSALNCSLAGDKSPALNVYDQMMDTKRAWGNVDGRQGYDLIISFPKGENDKAKCWEILQNVAQELFGDRYETMICMHTNTDYLHGHITINSVSFVDGKKFRYEPGEWKECFQSVIDKYAMQAGYSKDQSMDEKEKTERVNGEKANWTVINKEDIDEAVRQSGSYEEFETAMRSMGYYMDYGKQAGETCLKVRKAASGQDRYRRCTEKTLGYAYTLEGIRERIASKGKAYPKTAVAAVPVAVGIRYNIRFRKQVFRKWKDLSPIERFQLRQFQRFRNTGRTGYRINWKVVGKYRRLAEDSIRKRDLLIKYGVNSYSKFDEAREKINQKKKACCEKLKELRHQEAVFWKETDLYRKRQSCIADGRITDAEELSRKLVEEYGHSVSETGKFVQQMEEQKKRLKKEVSTYKREQKKLDEIQRDFARTYDLPEPEYLKEEPEGKSKSGQKKFFQKN